MYDYVHDNLWWNYASITRLVSRWWGYFFLLCGSEAEVVEDLRLQGAEGLQEGRDKTGSMRLQSGTSCLTDLHQGLNTSRL